MLSSNWITQDVNKSLHIGIFFEVAEELQQEEADRVIGETGKTIFLGDNGADKREVYQGRDASGKSADDPAVGMDFDVAALVVVFGKPEDAGLWKWPVVLRADPNANAVEFLDDAAQGEGRQVPVHSALLEKAPAHRSVTLRREFALSRTLFFLDVENSECTGFDPFEHASALDLFSHGRNDAVAI